MGRKDLLKQCRYYKGETENPFEGKGNNDALFWFYEQKWVEWTIKQDSFQYLADEYSRLGLADFHTEIPITLRAILYNRYDHWAQGGVEDFKKFLECDYLKTSDEDGKSDI